MKKHLRTTSLLFSLAVLTHLLYSQESNSFKQATPESLGISSDAVLEFVQDLEAKIDAVHSFMIIRHGKLAASGWWDPYDPQTPHLMHSLSKSFTSTAIGLAIEEGLLSLDDLVLSFSLIKGLKS